MFAPLTGDEAVPRAAGDGFAITTTADGGLQLALYWTDHEKLGGERHTVIVQGGMLRFFDSLGAHLQTAVKGARQRKIIQLRGELSDKPSGRS